MSLVLGITEHPLGDYLGERCSRGARLCMYPLNIPNLPLDEAMPS
jgi:hypothetical protein